MFGTRSCHNSLHPNDGKLSKLNHRRQLNSEFCQFLKDLHFCVASLTLIKCDFSTFRLVLSKLYDKLRAEEYVDKSISIFNGKPGNLTS